jgi:hypothetical protein
MFPYRQTIRVAAGSTERTARLAQESVSSHGFSIVMSGTLERGSVVPPSGTYPRRRILVGERNVRRDASDRPVRAAIWTLVASGVILGAVDSALIGAWVVLVPWIAAFSIVAGVFWFAYGRCYRSEVVMVVVEVDSGPGSKPMSADPSLEAHTVTWLAGRVRSDLRTAREAHSRRAVRVDPAFGLIRVIADTIRTFTASLEGPTPA